jgi:hypothetical protein
MGKKSKNIEKETRRLMESISDLIKRKGDRFKFKSGKKKQIRRVKRVCPHWIFRKGKEVPTVTQDPNNPKNWKCKICGATFPINPLEDGRYFEIGEKFLELVNQTQFFSVKMGGDAEDTKVFLKLKELVPRYLKIQKNIIKQIVKRQKWDEDRNKSNMSDQFDSYSGFNYKM